MPIPSASEAHYRSQQVLAATTLRAARRIWSQIHPLQLDRSWQTAGPRLVVLLASAQQRAATDGALYVPEVVEEQGLTAPPVAEVNPAAFARVASSGVDLDSVVYTPIIRAKQSIADGDTGTTALRNALPTLDGIVLTQIADAARGGASAAMVARPRLQGYTRMLNTPSCSRCVVLAGKFFRWNAGFARHPRCDCRHIPTTEAVAGDLTVDPKAYFRSLDATEQNRIFTGAGAQAIRDGADIGQVVNARRGMTAAGTTTEGTTRRGAAGRRLAGQARLMPEQIYRRAANREAAIEGLRRNGFLV